MFSPIQGCDVAVESCEAHLIPEALGMSRATVISERDFDNQFGTRNDSVLVRFVRNAVSDEKEAEVAIYDERGEVMLHKTSVRAKTTFTPTSPTGVIQLGHLSTDLKRRVGLGIGSMLHMRLYSPDEEE